MASSDEYQQRQFFKQPIIGWVKLGESNAIRNKLNDGNYVTWIPHPIMEPELVKEGIEYFEKLKTK